MLSPNVNKKDPGEKNWDLRPNLGGRKARRAYTLFSATKLTIPFDFGLYISLRILFGELSLLSYSKHILGQRETLENFDICTRNVIIKFQYQTLSNLNPIPKWGNTFTLSFIISFLLTREFLKSYETLLWFFFNKM